MKNFLVNLPLQKIDSLWWPLSVQFCHSTTSFMVFQPLQPFHFFNIHISVLPSKFSVMLLICKLHCPPGKHYPSAQTTLGTYLGRLIGPLSLLEKFSELQSHLYVFYYCDEIVPVGTCTNCSSRYSVSASLFPFSWCYNQICPLKTSISITPLFNGRKDGKHTNSWVSLIML